MGCRQELEESGWSGSPPGMASRSLGRLKRSVIWTGIGKVFPLAWAEAGCRDRSRVFLWGGVGGGIRKGSRAAPSAWSDQTPPSALSRTQEQPLDSGNYICNLAPILHKLKPGWEGTASSPSRSH